MSSVRTVYSSLLFAEQGISGDIHVDLPTGFRYVVRDVVCYCNSSPFDGQGIIISSYLTQTPIVLFMWGLGDRDLKHEDRHFVIDGDVADTPGFDIKLDNTVSPVDVHISGYKLTLP